MRRSTRLAGALLLTLLFAMLLDGCGLPWPLPQPTPNPVLPDSQQIFRPLDTGVANGDLETLDPALVEFPLDQNLAQLIFPPLVTLNEQGAPVDWAAQSHEVSADGLTYTFHLRKGMTWSDGTPIDANTFAYSINRSEDPCTHSATANYLYPIKGAQAFNEQQCPNGVIKSANSLVGSSLLAPDPLTLQIILERPAGYFLTTLTTPAAWGVPKALIERYNQPVTNADGSVYYPSDFWIAHLTDKGGFGGNLYKLVAWTHPDSPLPGQLVLERNDRFWGVKPRLRRIEQMLYSSTDTLIMTEFYAGKGDVSPLYGAYAQGTPFSDLQETYNLKGVTAQESPLLQITGLSLDWHTAPFDDVRVRQAFSLALDRQAIAREAYYDRVQPSIHLVPEDMTGYKPNLADSAGRIGAAALTADLDTARKLASAYAAEKCHGSFSACPPIVSERPKSSSASFFKLETMIFAQWQAAFPDWPITLKPYNGTQHVASYPGFFYNRWSAEYPDPQKLLSARWTTSSQDNQFANIYPLESIPQVDALCAQADGMQDLAARIPLYQQAEQLLVTQGAAIPLFQSEKAYAVRSRVANWRIAPTGMTPLSVWQQVYIKR